MEDKKALDKLAKITEHLKAISDKLSVVAGVDSKGGSNKPKKTLTPEEIAKVKITATETAKVYKSVLGLGFNQKDVDKTADRFRVVLGITPLFNSLQKAFQDIKTYIQSSVSGKGKTDENGQVTVEDLEKIFDKKKLFENSLISQLSNLNATSLDTYNSLSNSTVNKDLITELSNIKNVLGTNTPRNYDDVLDKIVDSLDKIGTGVRTKKYKSAIGSVIAKLDEIKSTFDTKIGKVKASASEYVRGINTFKRLLGWDELRYAILDYVDSTRTDLSDLNHNMEQLVYINDGMRDKMNGKDSKGGKGEKDSTMNKIGKIAGLLALGAGLFLIVNALVSAGSINIMQIIKVIGIIGAFVALFVLVSKAGEGIRNASIGFAILAATVLLLVLPLMEKLSKMDYPKLLNGLIKMAIVVASCIGLMVLMNFIKASEVIKSSLGLALLIGVIGFLAIPFFQYLASLNFDVIIEGLLKFAVIFAACYGMVFLMQKIKAGDVVKSSLGLTLLTLLMGFVVIPLLLKMSILPFDKILDGLLLMGLAVLGLAAILRGTGEILTRGKNAGISSIAGLVAIGLMSLLLGYLADTLVKFAGKPWQEILTGLGAATLAIVAFGAVVIGVGYIVTKAAVQAVAGAVTLGVLMLLMYGLAETMNKFSGDVDWGNIYKNLGLATLAIIAFGVVVGIVGAIAIATAPFIAAGAVTFLALEAVMYGLAGTLLKFNEVNAGQIEELGKSLVVLSAGLIAFLGGSAAGAAVGVVNGLTGLFKMDPASQIKKFETIDADKIFKLGMGLANMAQGLRELSNGGIDLKDVTNQMIQMTKPLTDFSSALDAFSNAYAKIDKVKLQSEYTMNVEKDDSIQKAIKSLHEQELSVQQAQLAQLQQNGEYLRIMASNQKGNGGNQPISSPTGGKGESISGPNFSTKEKYLNNLKLATMSFEA